MLNQVTGFQTPAWEPVSGYEEVFIGQWQIEKKKDNVASTSLYICYWKIASDFSWKWLVYFYCKNNFYGIMVI